MVCDAKVNSYVDSVFMDLLKQPAMNSDVTLARREAPIFYVVKSFEVKHNYDFEAIDGSVAICSQVSCTYQQPRASSSVQYVVHAADGAILIADIALSHLTNEAEFAALISYSLSATDQNLINRLFRVQLYKTGYWSYIKNQSGVWISQLTWNMNKQVLRLGIQQMYSAGYDIRYAPLAWSVEQGKHIKGSLIVADPRQMPWYGDYGFNVISQLYPNVDYSKLKRGEREYQQFLQELRKADPEAFAPPPPRK